MAEWASTAPPDFNEAAKNLPAGVAASGRLLAPVVRLYRERTGFRAALVGVGQFGGRALSIEAPSLWHNWVLDGITVRPLPADVAKTVELIRVGGADGLSFSDIVRLLSLRDPPIRIEADPSVLKPAKSEAEN